MIVIYLILKVFRIGYLVTDLKYSRPLPIVHNYLQSLKCAYNVIVDRDEIKPYHIASDDIIFIFRNNDVTLNL